MDVLSSKARRPPLKMDIVSITSTRNPIVAQLRELKRASERQKQGRILIEGTHQVSEAIATGWPLLALLSTEEWLSRNHELASSLSIGVRRYSVPSDLLRRVATTDSPDGVVAIGERTNTATPFSTRQIQLGVLLDGVQDPGNMGNIIRCAAAVEADAVFATPESVAADHPKVIRASAGQWFRKPPSTATSKELFAQCKASGVRILAAAAGNMTPYWEMDLRKPFLLVLGSEGAGVSRESLDQADGLISVPMAPGVESLNVALCGGLILYESFRQRSIHSSQAVHS